MNSDVREQDDGKRKIMENTEGLQVDAKPDETHYVESRNFY